MKSIAKSIVAGFGGLALAGSICAGYYLMPARERPIEAPVRACTYHDDYGGGYTSLHYQVFVVKDNRDRELVSDREISLGFPLSRGELTDKMVKNGGIQGCDKVYFE